MNGNDGNDFINGEVSDDILNGGAGNDRLLGSYADDTLIGGSGDDTLDGGSGIDGCNGGTAAPRAGVASHPGGRWSRTLARPRLIRWRPYLAALAVVYVATLAALTSARSGLYVDPTAIYRDTLSRNPEAYGAHAHLGNLALQRKDWAEGERRFREAARLNLDDPDLLAAHASALLQLRRYEEALVGFVEVAKYRPIDMRSMLGMTITALLANPDAHTDPSFHLETDPAELSAAETLAHEGRFAEAGEYYERIYGAPLEAKASLLLHSRFLRRGDATAAEQYLQRARTVRSATLAPPHPPTDR